jgi:predicted GH43/DUF377 family glycosyl hydrolase
MCIFVLLVLIGLSTSRSVGADNSMAAPVHGKIVLPASTGKWDSNVLWRPCVVKTDSGFLMWYNGEDGTGIDRIGLATSSDGVSWTRYPQNPVLTEGTGGEWDRGSANEAWVIYEDGLFKMWYSGETLTSTNPSIAQIATYQIGYATSKDGIHWTKYSGNPVLTTGPTGSWDDRWVWRPIVLSTSSSWLMYYSGESKAGATGVGIARSTDGVHWTKTTNFALPKSSWDSSLLKPSGSGASGVVKVNGGYLMSYSGWAGVDSPWQIGFATSTDGVTWTPYGGNPVIGPGTTPSDNGGVMYPMVMPQGSNYYVYYATYANGQLNRAIGLAILPQSSYAVPEYPSPASVSYSSEIALRSSPERPVLSS